MAKIVYIGSAVRDENHQARGGQAGNQTGDELVIEAWYQNKKEWIVLRPKDPEIAEKLAYDMDAACHNKYIGYDQGDRNTLRSVAKKVGYDCAKVKTPCECDCSSLVGVCCIYAGVTSKHFNTASEVEVLMATGKFDKLTESKYTEECDYLRRGDILVTRVKGHTAIVLNNGDKVEESDPIPEMPVEPPVPDPSDDVPTVVVMIRVKGTVRVREKNSALSKKIKTVGEKGKYTYIPYLGQAEERPYWYKTEVDGKEGYISSDPKYTKLVEVPSL